MKILNFFGGGVGGWGNGDLKLQLKTLNKYCTIIP